MLITCSRFRLSGIEGLCLPPARFRSPEDHYDLSMQYDRPQSAISEIVNELCTYLDGRWGHLLDFDRDGILSPEQLERYADAIHQASAPLDSIWGFLDCMIRCMCRLSRYQRQAYGGHKKVHALKYQAMKLPNGLMKFIWASGGTKE